MTVTLDQALASRSDAIAFLRSGNVSAEDKAAVSAQWGAEWVINVLNQSSEDENNYIIDDDIYTNAYKAGQENAKDVSDDAAGRKAGDAAKVAGTGVGATLTAGAAVGTMTGKLGVQAIGKAVAGQVASKIAGKIAGEIAGKVGAQAAQTAIYNAGAQVGSKLTTKIAGDIAGRASAKLGGQVITGTAEKTAEKVTEEAAKQAVSESSQETGKQVGKQIGFMITCTLGAATAAIYLATRPNKKAKEGIDKLQNTMTESQNALQAEQTNMEQATNDIAEKSEEAEDIQEGTQENIDEQKTAYDKFFESFMELKAKVDSGKPLTEDEKALFGALVQYLKECGVNIEDLVKASSDEVKDILDQIGLSEEQFNQAMETIGEVQGTTDYAASTDEATRLMCYMEAGMQGINAASSAVGAYQAIATATSGSWFFGATAWAWVFAALGLAGAAGSGAAVVEQLKFASEISTEINMRMETEDVNTETNDLWEQSVATYDEYLSYVGDMEIVKPEDVDPDVVDELNPDDIPTADPEAPGLVYQSLETTILDPQSNDDDQKKFLFVDTDSAAVT